MRTQTRASGSSISSWILSNIFCTSLPLCPATNKNQKEVTESKSQWTQMDGIFPTSASAWFHSQHIGPDDTKKLKLNNTIMHNQQPWWISKFIMLNLKKSKKSGGRRNKGKEKLGKLYHSPLKTIWRTDCDCWSPPAVHKCTWNGARRQYPRA